MFEILYILHNLAIVYLFLYSGFFFLSKITYAHTFTHIYADVCMGMHICASACVHTHTDMDDK